MNARTSVRNARAAFAIADLLVTLAMLSIGAFVALPAAANNRASSNGALCLSNLRQLAAAWQLYAAENNDVFVQNYHGSSALDGGTGKAPWASGWLDWTLRTDNTNTWFLRDVRYSRLAPYLNSSRNIHKCPSDKFLSAAQRARGWKERVRTVSLNMYLGDGNSEMGPTDLAYVKVRRFSEFSLVKTKPSELFSFLDEHPDSMNDPAYWPTVGTRWIDLPGSLHQGAGSLAFVDGHAELHAWRGSTKTAQVRLTGFFVQPLPNDPDIAWVREHGALRR
jgi:prepilin-type processing-associated H-X9-DG protein